MIGLWITLGLIVAIATFFSWTIIHELCHLAALRLVKAPLVRYKIVPYPHKYDGKFYWGRITYMLEEPLDKKQQVWVSYAPRVADYVGIWFLVIFTCFTSFNFTNFLIVVFLFGSVVDLFVGSLGISPSSDLKRYSNSNTKWMNRVTQMISVFVGFFFALVWCL